MGGCDNNIQETCILYYGNTENTEISGRGCAPPMHRGYVVKVQLT